jgi:dTDP-4-amino-4,6-dideoxygalactose transaminase
VPLHNSLMGKKFNSKKLVITENIYKKVVRLPLYPDMTNNEIAKILKTIKNFFNEKKKNS